MLYPELHFLLVQDVLGPALHIPRIELRLAHHSSIQGRRSVVSRVTANLRLRPGCLTSSLRIRNRRLTVGRTLLLVGANNPVLRRTESWLVQPTEYVLAGIRQADAAEVRDLALRVILIRLFLRLYVLPVLLGQEEVVPVHVVSPQLAVVMEVAPVGSPLYLISVGEADVKVFDLEARRGVARLLVVLLADSSLGVGLVARLVVLLSFIALAL